MTAPRTVAPILAATALSIATGCDLPSRNPLDPAVRPVAQLAIANGPASYADALPGTVPHASCSTPNSESDSFSRARCLFLDASESTDPQGADDLETFVYDLSYQGEHDDEFHFSCSGGVVTILDSSLAATVLALGSASNAALSCANANLASVSPDLLREFPSGHREVRVRVLDGNGGYADAVESLSVTNQTPVAIIAGTKLIPHYGRIWTMPLPFTGELGDPVETVFDASASHDEDGDVLHHCWVEEGGSPADCGGMETWPFQPQYTMTVASSATPTGAGVTVFVTDGEEVSPAEKGAAFGQPSVPGWAFSREGESAQLLDLRRRSYSKLSGQVGRAKIVASSGPGWEDPPYGDTNPARAVFGRSPGNIVASALVGGTSGGPVYAAALTAGDEVLSIEVDESGPTPLVWAIAAAAGTRALRVYALAPDTSVPGLARPFTILDSWESLDDIVGPTDRELVALDPSSGMLWVGVAFRNTVQGLRFDNGAIDDSETPIAIADGRMLTGLAVRRTPGGSELWALESHDVFGGGEGDPPAFRRRIPGETTETTLEYGTAADTGGVLAMSPGFIGSPGQAQNRVWVNLLGIGLVLLELDDTQADPFTILAYVPEMGDGLEYVVDPFSGTYLLLTGGKYELQRALPTGTFLTSTSGYKIADVQRSSDGRVWTFLPSVPAGPDAIVSVGAGTGREGVLMTAPLETGIASPVVDYPSGDLWMPTVFSPGAQRMGAAGTVIDRFTSIRQSPTASPVVPPPARLLASDPVTGNLWMATTDDALYLVAPTANRILDAREIAFSGGVDVPLLAAGDSRLEGHRIEDMAVSPAALGQSALIALTTCFDTCPGTHGYYLRRITLAGASAAVEGPATPFLTAGTPVLNTRAPRFSRDLSDGGVCVAWIEGTNDIRTQRFDALLQGGAPRTVTVPGSLQLDGVGAGPIEDCWVAATQNGNQRLALLRFGAGDTIFLRAGTTIPSIASFTPVLDVDHLKGANDEQMWMGADGFVRMGIVPSGAGFVLDVQEVLDTVDTTSLIAP